MGRLEGQRLFRVKYGDETDLVLHRDIYEIDGFRLRAFDELEIFWESPEPHLEIDLSSAAIIAWVKNLRGILLVEFLPEDGVRRVELPAGKVDIKADNTIYDTAIREFKEETGGIIPLPQLTPFYVSYHTDGRGGLQFFTQIPGLSTTQKDELGRRYITPPMGTDNGRVLNLIVEPLDVFLDPKNTLLRHSRNQWAMDDVVRLTLGVYAHHNKLV